MKNFIITFLLLFSLDHAFAQENRVSVLQNLENNQGSSVTATLKSSSRLFGDKNDLTSVIMIIPSGSEVDVVGSDSLYLQVIFEENEGYIYKRHAIINKLPESSRGYNQRQESVQEAQPVRQERVSRFTYLEGKYGTSLAASLNAGKIWKGMTAEMVRDSWGNPLKINRVINSNTIKEEWIFKNTWLYLENEILEEWGPIRK